jgi:hypothetical protein
MHAIKKITSHLTARMHAIKQITWPHAACPAFMQATAVSALPQTYQIN